MFHARISFDIRMLGLKLLKIIIFKIFNKLNQHPNNFFEMNF